MEARELPKVTIDGEEWYLDRRLKELRQVANPHVRMDLADWERPGHTPGPWYHGERFKIEHDKPYFAYGIGNGAEHVGYAYAGMIPHEEAVANATLISSAPELLEACKALEPRLDRAGRGDLATGPQGRDRDWDQLKAKLRAAIAKAEGADHGQ